MPKITVQEKVTREINLTFEQLFSIIKSLSQEELLKLKEAIDQTASEKYWLLEFAGGWQLDDDEHEQFQHELQEQRRLNTYRATASVDEEESS